MNLIRLCLIGAVAAASLPATSAEMQAPLTVKLPMEMQKDYFREKCFTLELGQQLAYQLSTPYPIEFNLHHHPDDGDTVFPDRLIVKSQHSKRIVAESAGAYCFMATNLEDHPRAFDVVITYEIAAQ